MAERQFRFSLFAILALLFLLTPVIAPLEAAPGDSRAVFYVA